MGSSHLGGESNWRMKLMLSLTPFPANPKISSTFLPYKAACRLVDLRNGRRGFPNKRPLEPCCCSVRGKVGPAYRCSMQGKTPLHQAGVGWQGGGSRLCCAGGAPGTSCRLEAPCPASPCTPRCRSPTCWPVHPELHELSKIISQACDPQHSALLPCLPVSNIAQCGNSFVMGHTDRGLHQHIDMEYGGLHFCSTSDCI